MFVRYLCVLIFLSLTLTACGQLEDPSQVEFYYDEVKSSDASSEAFALVNGTPEVVGVLAFINDEATSFRMLDDDAKLDRRAARGIIHHRNGPDGIYGTWDDEPFESIEALDAVKWVGRASMSRLIEYASIHGWVPSEDQLLGVYDGVAFTVNEADQCVWFVNSSTSESLDLFLNRRAAIALYENGPYASVEEIARVRFVGRTALRKLKQRAQPTIGK